MSIQKIKIYGIVLILMLIITSQFIFATDVDGKEHDLCEGKTDCYQLQSPLKNAGIECLIYSVIVFIAEKVMPPIAVLMILWASFLLFISTGDPEQAKHARSVIIWTVIGVMIIILAPVLTNEIFSLFKGDPDQFFNPLKCSGATPSETLITIIVRLVNWFSWFLTLVALSGGLYSGFLYMTAGGDKEQIQKASRAFLYVIIGIIVAIVGFSIIQIIEHFIL